MSLPPRKIAGTSKERALWADLMSLGLVIPIAIVLGFFLGRWLGGLFGHPEPGQWIGLVWGLATAGWELYKMTLRANAADDLQTGPEEGPRPPGGGGA